MKDPLERVGRDHLGDDLLEHRPRRENNRRRLGLLLERVQDLVRDGLADGGLLEHVGRDIGKALRVGEAPPAPQRQPGRAQ